MTTQPDDQELWELTDKGAAEAEAIAARREEEEETPLGDLYEEWLASKRMPWYYDHEGWWTS